MGGCLVWQRAPAKLELIQNHITQKPMLRVEVGARAMRVLIKKRGWTGRASADVQGTSLCVWACVSLARRSGRDGYVHLRPATPKSPY